MQHERRHSGDPGTGRRYTESDCATDGDALAHTVTHREADGNSEPQSKSEPDADVVCAARDAGYDPTMNDESRRLRYRLGTLCERYNAMIADKDTLDYRLGSSEPYGDTLQGLNAEAVYERASHTVTADLRTLIVELIEVGERIRKIEDF